ncbi:hypothetical protein [Beijerinckia sp. L45]|uniref:hypothetical protein n=1 Tax=Beijerinckia sp. L45 TaxID=1641855 RepID=UPI00131A6280|nr:hypothetical protein [Beijerinckia sp. L45]
MKRLAPLIALLLAGCGAQDCALDLAHGSCPGVGPVAVSQFPRDDASCRSYGLRPGTRAYAKCREQKRHVQRLTKDETDYGFLRNPLLPDVH